MSHSGLPDRPSLEFLKKRAKERLLDLRRTNPEARLADAQLAIARDLGFGSWRALKAEIDKRNSSDLERFYAACFTGDLETLRALLARDPSLVRQRGEGGTTPLHATLRHPATLRFLLSHGADPNLRDEGDNALALHFAAGYGPIESVRVLLDAGSDVHGAGDHHAMDVIGWATVFAEPRRDVVALLLDRGARHNIFSAIAMGDEDLVAAVIARDPSQLARRLSKNEQEQTPLHYVIAPADGLVGGTFRTGEHYRLLERLLALGADVQALDAKGRTPLDIAMLREDREAMRLLHLAGARPVQSPPVAAVDLPALRKSVRHVTPMVAVADVDATVAWFQSVGFELTGSHADAGRMDWAEVRMGRAAVMLVPSSPAGRMPIRGISLWFETDRIDELYQTLKARQLARALEILEGREPADPQIRFKLDIHDAFYGQREFGIEDPNGVEVMFAQPHG